jgi:hypothetical protein
MHIIFPFTIDCYVPQHKIDFKRPFHAFYSHLSLHMLTMISIHCQEQLCEVKMSGLAKSKEARPDKLRIGI